MNRPLTSGAINQQVPAALRDLIAVAAAHFTRDGTLLDANAGFRRLMPASVPGSAPCDLRNLFISPRFDSFAARRGNTEDGAVYSGILTLGESCGDVVALRGSIVDAGSHLALIAEHDVEQMEASLRVLHALTSEMADAQRMPAQDDADRHEQDRASRERRLRIAVEAGGVGIWDWDVETGIGEMDQATRRMLGLPSSDTFTLEDVLALVHPDDRAGLHAATSASVAGRRPYAYKFRTGRAGAYRWIMVVGTAYSEGEGESLRLSGLMLDVTGQQKQEEHHQLLLGELHHRMRNVVAVVKIMARKSITCDPAQMQAFFGRLDALARAHRLTSAATRTDTRLPEVVFVALEPHLGGEKADCIRISGPEIILPAPSIEALLLALHELATNAVKYGALSADGRVSVTWTRAEDDDGRSRVILVWRETGGPPVAAPPARTGFGTRLIEKAIESAGGTAVRDWRKSGLVVTLTIALH
jgi:PAS domain S-box-containing protein